MTSDMLSVRRTNDLYLCCQIPAEMHLSCENVEQCIKSITAIIFYFKAFLSFFAEVCDKALLLSHLLSKQAILLRHHENG